jgi:DNA-binding Lrp family transcriptional regulator
LFDIKRPPEKYHENEQKIELDKTDVRLLSHMITGGARKTILDLANELNTTCSVIKYRKKRLIQNGYFLYFIAQPGEAFKSLKISISFSLTENNLKTISCSLRIVPPEIMSNIIQRS